MEGVLRKDDALQSKALREAVTNKVIRSDFVVNGVLRIEKYRNCFVLTNPGLLKLPISQNIMVENKKDLKPKVVNTVQANQTWQKHWLGVPAYGECLE